MNDLAAILLNDLALAALLFGALWLVSIALRDPSFVDAWWGLGVVVLAWATYVQLPAPGPHAVALALLATAWGLRLGVYLLWRWFGHGKDRRYQKLEAQARDRGLGFAAFSLLWVFAPQMLLQFIVALPVTLGQIGSATSFGPLGYFGLTLATFGIIYETLADAQLTRFKSDPANAGKVMDKGLWRYSRHPNYFGELCAWWGIYSIAAETGLGIWSVVGPVLLTFLLTRVSGAPTTEPHLQRTRTGYASYKERTSAFFPLPPRRR